MAGTNRRISGASGLDTRLRCDVVHCDDCAKHQGDGVHCYFEIYRHCTYRGSLQFLKRFELTLDRPNSKRFGQIVGLVAPDGKRFFATKARPVPRCGFALIGLAPQPMSRDDLRGRRQFTRLNRLNFRDCTETARDTRLR